MISRKLQKCSGLWLVSISTALAIYCCLHWSISYEQLVKRPVRQNYFDKNYFVATKNCMIPKLDPWDASIKEIVSDVHTSNCSTLSKIPDLTTSQSNLVTVNLSAIPYYKSFGGCKLKEFYRRQDNDNQYYYEKKSQSFKVGVRVRGEFVKVSCFREDKSFAYSNFYAFAPPKPAVEKRCQTNFERYKSTNQNHEYFNVLAIGLDSVSQLNFHRKFNKTRHFLLNELHGIEMYGYSKVADNTFVNLTPFLEGKFIEETGWNETQAGMPFDNHDLIWKKYSKAGYMTLLAEDDPSIATWNYLKAGFKRQPTDYYYRPFAVALDRKKSQWSKDNRCFGQRSQTGMLLDYVAKFVQTSNGHPYFAFSFLSGDTHSSLNYHTDELHLKFLQDLYQRNSFANTFVIYFSDHGMRYGPIVEHYIGKLEERMPAMYIVPPPGFQGRYPALFENLKQNGHQLTTPFDMHAFLEEILNFKAVQITSHEKQFSRGVSFFQDIPYSRTCQTAGIDDHWCPCMLKTPIPTTEKVVRDAARTLLRMVNSKISLHPLCAKLQITSIEDALVSEPLKNVLTFQSSLNDVINRTVKYGDSVQDFLTNYLITIKTKPGGALFESTVQHVKHSKRFSVIGDVSRINAYGHQGNCIAHHSLKKFCFCKSPMQNV